MRITGPIDIKTKTNDIGNAARQSVSSASALTVGSTISTLVTGESTVSLPLSQYIFVSFRITGTKGGTAGKVLWTIDNTGTATMTFNGSSSAKIYDYVEASAAYETSFTIACHLTGAGTLGIRLQGVSSGSDLTSTSAIIEYAYHVIT